MIDKREIERIKRTAGLTSVIQSRGVKLRRRGKQLVGLCPFHDDHEPSLIVDPVKQLWNCLGACGEGGDVYQFVMKADGVDFREAHRRLGGRITDDETEVVSRETASNDHAWLDRAVEYYHKTLLQTSSAQEYLRSRGIKSSDAIAAFKIGYSDGTLSTKLSSEGRAALKRIGLLTETERELFKDCVVFPLAQAEDNRTVSLYGRHTKKRLHLYLPGEHRGIFNPSGARNTDEVIITESVIDALALWSEGIRNVIPIYGTNGLTEEILDYLEECRIKRAALMLDSDEAGRAAVEPITERLKEKLIEARAEELPAKDASEYIASGGTVEELRKLMAHLSLAADPAPDSEAITQDLTPPEPIPTGQAPVEPANNGAITYSIENREYLVRGLSASGLDRMRVNLKLIRNGSFHIDTLDLYQSRARQQYAQNAARACGVEESRIVADLLKLIEQLEARRMEMRRSTGAVEEQPMTASEKEEALEYLRRPDLCERIVEDFRKIGLVGERSTVLTAYLASISRKLSEPFGALVVARSGAGKSALQDALCALTPPEDVVRVTRLTGQALFYKDPYSLQRKLLAIAEEEGASQAVYSLRTLASDQRLSIAATRTDPQTGKLHTEHYEVYGPVVIIITTTSPEAFDEETRSRFVLLTMDESREQTRAILERQRKRYTLEGALERAKSDQTRKLHHNAQRLLMPLEVINPHIEELTYPDDRLIHRREQKKYLSLINAIALLHQHQREIKRAVEGGVEIEYVEVTEDDIVLANELANEVLKRSLDEVAPPVRGMYREVRGLCKQRAEATGCKPEQVQLTRREIREATGWSDWQVRVYCAQLVDMEYLYLVSGSNGKRFLYELAEYNEGDSESLGISGLVDAEALKKRLKEKRGGNNGANLVRK